MPCAVQGGAPAAAGGGGGGNIAQALQRRDPLADDAQLELPHAPEALGEMQLHDMALKWDLYFQGERSAARDAVDEAARQRRLATEAGLRRSARRR